MSRYIDKDKLLSDELTHTLPIGCGRSSGRLVVFVDDIEDAPTADVEEVRHGSWIVRGLCNPKCSICGKYGYYKDAFCPNCGAKMDGERSENGT